MEMIVPNTIEMENYFLSKFYMAPKGSDGG